MSVEENKKTVEALWQALSEMDWATLKGCMTGNVFYEDVATEDAGAHGPENVVKRLAIAFNHLSGHQHTIHHILAEGDVVFLDHTEVWTFKTGETATNKFATVHEMKGAKVAKWSDYWDVSSFVAQFPKSFLEEMAKASEADFSD